MKNYYKRLCSLLLIMALTIGNLGVGITVPAQAGAPDALTTYSQSSLPSSSMSDVAYGAGMYVAVGYYGAIIASTDGETWTNIKTKADSSSYTGVTAPDSFGFSSINYGAGVFVAAGSEGVILTSPDGLNWTQRNSGVTSGFADVEYLTFNGSSDFYIGSNGKVLKSADGITWTSFTPSGLTTWVTEITVGESGTRLVVGRDNGDIYHSTNGTTWSTVHPQTAVADGTAYSSGNNMLKWVNGRYYISDPSAWVWTSTNLSSFTLLGAPYRQTIAGTGTQVFNMIYDGSAYYSYGYHVSTGYGAVFKSTDGTSWSLQPYKNYIVAQSSAYLNGKYFRLGNEGLMVSNDGANWAYKWGGLFNDIFYDGTNYIAVGKTGGDGSVWKSADLSTWTPGTFDAYVGQFVAGAYANGKYVAVGENNNSVTTLATSSDGSSWTKKTSMTDGTNLYDVTSDGSTFVAVGTKSNTPVVRYSTDGGDSWTNATFTAPGSTVMASVDYVNNQFIALGYDASGLTTVCILTSNDGITWTNHGSTFPGSTDQPLNIVYDGTEYVLMSMNSTTYEITLRHSTNLTTWTTGASTDLTGNYAYSSQLSAYNGKVYLVALDLDTYSILSLSYSEDHGQTVQNTSAISGSMAPFGTVNINNRLVVFGDGQLVLATPPGPVNATPTVGSGISTTFTEQTPIAVASTITVDDSDGDSEWDGGTLQVQITANATASDSLYLPTTNGGGIWVNTTGNKLMSNTTEIGTVSGASVTNNTALSFTFNSSATNALVQSVAQAVQFNNTLDNPSNTARTVTFTATDKNAAAGSATVTLNISRVNDTATGVPTVSGSAVHNQTLTSSTAAIADLDGLGSYSYQWQVSNDGSTGWSDIASATSSSYLLASAQVNKYVRIKVSFTDGSGNAEVVYSAPTGQITVVPAYTATAAAASTTPTAGASNTITLTVLDSLGNTDTTFNGAKNVTVTGMSPAPNGSYGSVKATTTTGSTQVVSLTFTNGVATVDLKLNKATAQTIGFAITDVGTSATNTLTITPTAGAVSALVVTTQPVPGPNSGSAFGVQPTVTLKDQFENVCATGVSATANVVATAKAGTGSYALGGTTTKGAVAGVATFTDLTASLLTVGNGAITFTSTETVDSNTFTIPLKVAVSLTADTTANTVDNDLEVTFPDDATFRAAITGVSYNGNALLSGQYAITAGKITLKPSAAGNTYLRTPATGTVVVTATGYNSSSVTQTINAGAVASLVVSTQPVPGAASGDAFGTQPVVTLKDQYGNTCSTGVSVTATVVATTKAGTGSYTLGGTTSKAAVGGVATFTDLTAALLSTGTGGITFTTGAVTVDSNLFTIPLIASKTLTADSVNNNVDNDIEITFTDDVAFRSAITGITYGGHALTANQYVITAGKITLKPSVADNNYLRTAGTATVVITASGFNNSSVSQTLLAGEVASMTVSTQPVAGSGSGSAFATQPVVTLKDQYGNTCSTGPSVTANVVATAKAGTGTYTLGGTMSKAAVGGVATFTDLTTTLLTSGNAAVTFTSGAATVDSASFTIPLKAAVVLTADTTGNSVDSDIEITFTDDAAFRSGITGITYNGNTLTASQYVITAGKITLKPSVAGNTYLRTAGTGTVVITASGYNSSSVSQTLTAGAASSMVMTTQPVAGASSGSALATQPVVTLKDQYGNICSTGPSATATVVATAKAGTGSHTLGGTTSVAAVGGVATFTDLTVALLTSGSGAITFTSGAATVDSTNFTIPLKAAVSLTADTTANSVDNDLEITFTDDAAFRSGITGITYNGQALTADQYLIGIGKIVLKPSIADNNYLRAAGTATVVVTASGYNNSSVSQTITAGAVSSMVINTQPVAGSQSGSAFATQPVLTLKDQYGNTCTTGPSVTATVVATAKAGTGTYTLGGTTSKAAVGGVVTFTDLTLALLTSGNGAMTFTSGAATVDSGTFSIPLKAAVVLTADTTGNSVDGDIEITFTDDAAFRSGITGITYGGHTLTADQYVIGIGKIVLKPGVADNNYLRTAGTGNVVITASGYNSSSVSQTLTAGAVSSMVMTTQPVAGSQSGNAFATQPVLTLKDQYGNTCSTGPSATATVVATAKAGTGTFTLGGTSSVAAVGGVVTFTDLSVALLTSGNGAITFTSGAATVDSASFTIPLKAAVVLTADTTGNTVDSDIEITFTDDAAFRSGITSITYDGHALTADQYVITAGKITLKPSVADNNFLRTASTGNVVIVASGYVNTSVSQSILVGAPAKLVMVQNVTGPTANGIAFAQQPKVAVQDQYGNILTADNSTVITASKKDSGQWTLDGTKTATVVNGVATFSGLKATNSFAVTGAQLAFDSGVLTQALSALVNLPSRPDDSPSVPVPPPAPPAQPGAIVVINGKAEDAGKEVVTTEANKSVVTVVVNNTVIEAKIDSAIVANPTGQGNLVEVSVTNTKSDVAKVELTGDIVKKLETNTFDIAVNRDNVSYVIPAKELAITTVAESLGVKTEALKDIKIEVQITTADTSTKAKYDQAVKTNGSEIVFPPTTFEIVAKTTAVDGTTSDVKIEKFTSFVERILEIPAGVDPTKITTGVVFNADGTFSHVPTEVYQKDGKWFAKLNSLTNSDYSVIWNPIAVPSVDKHWSKTAVYDMASRLVVMDHTTFKPNAAITRADFAEYIVRALGLYREGSKHDNPFTDVKATDERALAIFIANEYGIIKGYSDGTFKPNAFITREEAMTMYEKAMAITKLVSSNPDKYKAYTDYNQASEWAKVYIQTVVGAGVFNGKTATSLEPKANLTYAEAVQAIRNLLVASKLINQ